MYSGDMVMTRSKKFSARGGRGQSETTLNRATELASVGNSAEAFALFAREARAGNLEAMYRVGRAYYEADGDHTFGSANHFHAFWVLYFVAFAFGMVLGYAMEELIREKVDNTTWTGVGGAGHIPARLFLQ